MDPNSEKIETCPACKGRKQFWANDGKYLKRRWVNCRACGGKGYRDGNDLIKILKLPQETDFKLFQHLVIYQNQPNNPQLMAVVTKEDIDKVKSGKYSGCGW